MDNPVAAVMVHVPDWQAGLAWYAGVFPDALSVPGDYGHLRIGDLALEIVTADTKVAAGAAGTVVYWRVDSLTEALARFLSAGATLYRGPMAIEDGQAMCQVRDPWGNCIGLRGPA